MKKKDRKEKLKKWPGKQKDTFYHRACCHASMLKGTGGSKEGGGRADHGFDVFCNSFTPGRCKALHLFARGRES